MSKENNDAEDPVLNFLAQFNNKAIEQLGLPLTVALTGARAFVCVLRFDEQRNFTTLLEQRKVGQNLPLFAVATSDVSEKCLVASITGTPDEPVKWLN